MDPVQKQEQSHGVPCLLLFYIFVIPAYLSLSQLSRFNALLFFPEDHLNFCYLK